MNDILFDIDRNLEIFPTLENFKSYDEFLFEYIDTVKKLAGIIIIVNDKILLVKPKKSKQSKEYWSIPKGKVKKNSIIDTALLELEEETGITLSKEKLKNAKKSRVFYKKGRTIKELISFVVNLNKEDLEVDMNNKWEVNNKHFNTDEIYKAKFFTKEQALNKIEIGQLPIIKNI
jgi:8-oxo-dGTP pyrophosphatase MutT (NUDIX family)